MDNKNQKLEHQIRKYCLQLIQQSGSIQTLSTDKKKYNEIRKKLANNLTEIRKEIIMREFNLKMDSQIDNLTI